MRYSRNLALPVLLAALSLGGGITLAPLDAHAQQVSDADRKAARDLYNQGVTLQQASKFAEALDSFQRSFSVFPAPTTALHVAQCQASLGHLVEAEEDYRALSNANVPAGSPPAFYQAQDQARTEVAQISPRVPTIKIITTPAQIPNLAITIDGQSMNAALVGASRPVNPGTHKISASAPGYSSAEQTVTVQEKESKDVPLSLHSTGVAPPVTTQPVQRPVQQQGPMYSGEWTGRPYTPMRRSSPGLYGGGLAMVIVGSITAGIGLLVVAVGAAENSCNTAGLNCSSSGGGTVAGGVVATVIGVALVGGGIAMMVVGGKKVPATEAIWIPKPTAQGMAWTF